MSTNKSDTPPPLKLEEPGMEEDETRVGTNPEAGNLAHGNGNMPLEEAHKPSSKDESKPEQNEELHE